MVSGFHSLSCESQRGNAERAVAVAKLSRTLEQFNRECCEVDSPRRFPEVKIYSIDKLWGVQDDRVNPCLVTETFQL